MPPLFHLLTILLLLLHTTTATATAAALRLPEFQEAPAYQNGRHCNNATTIHIAMTLDATYLRGSVAGIFSIIQHSTCPENTVFHFLTTHRLSAALRRTIATTFPYLRFHLHHFNTHLVTPKISTSIRRSLDQPLNYARFYLPHLLPTAVHRVIYFDSDIIVVDDVVSLWEIDLNSHVVGAPEYCHANFTSYFTHNFWSNPRFSGVFDHRRAKACYFNTGVMVIDVMKWRRLKVTENLEQWMEVQKRYRIYELGSLPPLLLVFAGDVRAVEHRWNQHGLGGDNLRGLCRDLHRGPVSLLHWSGKGKPWLRLGSNRSCPLDGLWAPYDLVVKRRSVLVSDR